MLTPFATVATLISVLGATLVGAAPSRHVARQMGDLACNIARVKIVGGVLQAAQTARNLTQELASDPVGCVLIANVTTGIIEAEDAIAQIVGAIVNNAAAPPAARDQVGDGLNLAFEAAGNITSTDPAVIDNVNTLKNQLLFAGQAGDEVVQDCN